MAGSPARYSGLPGWPFPAPPFSHPTKDEVADHLEAYAARFELPVCNGVRVDQLARDDGCFLVTAGDRRWEVDQVVVGAGNSGAEVADEVSGAHPTWLSGPDIGHIPVRTGSRWDRLLTPQFWWFASRLLTVDTPWPGRRAHRQPHRRGRQIPIPGPGLKPGEAALGVCAGSAPRREAAC